MSDTDKDDLNLERTLFKLWHIEENIENNIREIKKRGKTLAGLREQQKEHDAELDAARASQAKARSSVMQVEKKIKKAEKALEGKVCHSPLTVPSRSNLHITETAARWC